MEYRVISTDDHLQEAPHTWTARMSKAKWGDKVPHVAPNGDGTDSWYIDGQRRIGAVSVIPNVAAVHGVMPDRTRGPARWEDVPAKAYVPAERIKAMEQDGVDVHTFFGNIAGAAGHTFSSPSYPDKDFCLDAIRAFNDYQIEEWAAAYPGRFITLGVVPMWDVDLAVAELKRTQKLGIHGLSFAFPQQYGYPHICEPYWHPLWDTAQESGLSINLHIGAGGTMGWGKSTYEGQHPDLQLAEASANTTTSNTAVMNTMLFSGILDRFPRLKLVSSESGLGWVPYVLELADHQFEQQRLWERGFTLKPSEYFHRQCHVNFWFEITGIALRHKIGIDNIMWESDYPHPTTTWPDSRHYIERALKDVPEDERRKILVENAVRVFNLTP